MGQASAAAILRQQSWLGAVQGLNLVLFVDAEHQRLLREIQIEPHHIREFSKNRGSLESLNPLMRCGVS